VQAAKLLGVVAVDRDHECTIAAVANRHAGGLLELGREGRPDRGRLEVERKQLVLAEVGLGDGREHARRDRRRAAAGAPTLENDDTQPGWGCAPSRCEPGDAGAHYGNIESAVRRSLPSPALPGSGAGGRRPTAALSARSAPGSRRM